jgi:hypothetical protein
MTRDDIIRMAREAGLHRQQHNLMSNPVQYRYSYDGYEENLERFAALVAAAERDRVLEIAKGMQEELQAKFEQNYMQGVIAGAAAEREACAKVCDGLIPPAGPVFDLSPDLIAAGCAAAIRART